MDRKTMIGQKLFTGLPGYEITDEFRALVKEHKVGNVILFARNIESPAQLKRLCGELQELILSETGLPAFIAIDQEGGNLARLHAPATVLPGAMGLGAAGDPELAKQAGYITGKELLACGVNMNFAPVMDVNNNPDNPVIGARSFSSRPGFAAEMACAWAEGLRKAGMADCAKHFPGHGDTQVDSHLALPVIDKSMEEMRACELIPFTKAVKDGVQTIMTAHIFFPQLEKEKIPATMSPAILQGLLRQELGFEGLIISDCMMMEAIAGYYGTVKGTVAAAKAGVDLILICHSNPLTAEACIALEDALEDEELLDSFRRIENMKKAFADPGYPLECVGCEEHRAFAEKLADKALTFAGGPEGEIPSLGENPLFVGCEPYRSTMAADPSSFGGILPRELQERFGGTALEIDSDPDDATIADVLARATKHTSLVVSTFNGRQQSGQRKLIESLKKVEVPVFLIAMRDPFDLIGMADSCWCLAAFDYTEVSVRAVVKAFENRLCCSGKMPVDL